jgi:peptidoglycan/xylan/chitin deacetylase (PgdA/CDA1 family)
MTRQRRAGRGKGFWTFPIGRRLRCALFHHIAASDDAFTQGLGITVSPDAFESRIRFLSRHYEPIGLSEVLELDSTRCSRPLLVTFDDAYGSVARQAAPILERWQVPAVFFVNAATVEGDHLPLDNLVSFVSNTEGFDAVLSALDQLGWANSGSLRTVREVIARVVSQLGPADVEQFVAALRARCSVEPLLEARRANLFLTPTELRALPDANVEIGNHTLHHVWCRHLDEAAAQLEVVHNAEALKAITGHPVRAFSVPYGDRSDLTPTVVAAIERSGHLATFLVESRANRQPPDLSAVQRVSLRDVPDLRTAIALEALPRIRTIRDRVRL